MEVLERLAVLSANMGIEPSEENDNKGTPFPQCGSLEIYAAKLPQGGTINLLKTLLTTVCKNDCIYCPFRAGRDTLRESMTADEMAKVFYGLFQAGIAQGLFLSSGIIKNGLLTQDAIIKTAEILRQRDAFKGYLHLKIMPGAEPDQVIRTMQLADRVSVNLEAPNALRLEKLAPKKDFKKELWQTLHYIDFVRRELSPQESWNGRWCSSATQFVVGAVGESDREILNTSQQLYKMVHLGRTFYSAFTPHKKTPLEDHPGTPLARQSHLYQASYLLRDYGFQCDEFVYTSNGNLLMECDPKMAWAQTNIRDSPVEINTADRIQLLRVPGIGPKGADRILIARKIHTIRELSSLRKMGIRTQNSAGFILLNGKRPDIQLEFCL
jgi:predicted DNA-binding helix-hairpin-helix protein